MADSCAFIAAIREAPGEDAPLLIYADWLEEQGRCERAELIRVQVELSRSSPRGPDASALRKREGELLRGRERAWRLEELPRIPFLSWGHFERGMVRSATTDHFRSFEESEALPSVHTALDTLRVRQPITSAWRFRKLGDVPPDPPEEKFAGSLDSEAWTSLRSISFRANFLGREFAEGLAGSRAFSNLVVLDLSENLVRDAGLAALAERGLFPSLRRLILSNVRAGDPGMCSLARARGFPNLEAIHVQRNRGIGDEGILALVRSELFPRLKLINLDPPQVSDAVREAFRVRFGLDFGPAHDGGVAATH